jgi:opacity protein-like surface antigen
MGRRAGARSGLRCERHESSEASIVSAMAREERSGASEESAQRRLRSRWSNRSAARSALCALCASAIAGLFAMHAGHARGDDSPADAPFFVLGPQQIGLVLGYGHGVSFAHSGVYEGHQVRELVVLVPWQIELTRRPLRPAWYKGTVAFRAEASLFVNFRPRTGVAGGLGLLLRYNFRPDSALTPYIQAGAGVIGLDFDLAEQADGLAFIPQFGFGFMYDLSERFELDAGMRFHHTSNAYTQRPNGGIDTLQFLVGFAYRFN